MNIFEIAKEKCDKKFIRRVLIRFIVAVYICVITSVVTGYSSKILLPDLFDNERVTVDGFMFSTMLLIGIVLFVKEKNIIKFLFAYHFVLIFTVFTAMMPYDKRPIVFVPMLFALLYDKSVGLTASIGICAFNVFTLSYRPDYTINGPEYMLILVMLVVAGIAVLLVDKKRKFYYEIPMYAIVYVLNVWLHGVFGSYCIDYPGCEIYCDSKFKFDVSVGVLISIIVMAIIRVIYGLFVSDIKLKKALEDITSKDYILVMEMNKNSKSLYNHSVEVAELSSRAAKLIGANEDVAFAGGLYHDIGKLAGTNYVHEGIRIAGKYGLPECVKNIIIEHSVKNRLPKSKESAIVMLADTAISAVEYMRSNNKSDFDEVAVFENSMITRLKKGALNDSTLTIEEFNKIKDVFMQHKVLNSK